MKRVFFDWSQPFLPSVARRVVSDELRRTPGTLDFGDLAFVLPGRRAVRTLEAYLQLEVEREIADGNAAPDWTPPRYWTVGAALEALYVSRRKPAERLTRLLCQARAFEKFAQIEPEKTRKLLKTVPIASNLAARLELAQIFVDLADELATERRDFRSVAASTRRRGLADETERWETLENIARLYRDELASIKETDLNAARENALKRGEVGKTFDADGATRRVFVVGAVDLNRVQKAFFDALGDAVRYFVFAPETEAAKFDAFGCVVPDAWEDAVLPISDECFFQVDSPSDQAKAAALLVGELSKKYDANGDWRYAPISPETLTVGVPDAQVVPFLEEEFRAVGYETIRAQGSPAPQNRVFQLLRNVADYLETRSFSALEELARRPDVEDFLTRNWNFVSLDGELGPENPENDETQIELGAADSLLDADADGAFLLDEEIRRANEALEAAADEGAIFDDDADFSDDAPTFPDELENDGETASETEAAAPTPFVPGDWLSEFDRYRATFLPTRVDGRWFEYKNEDAPRQNAEFRLLRKVALLIETALEPFCDENLPKIRREELAPSERAAERSGAETSGELDALKIGADELDAARDAIFSGEFAFAKDDFSERFRWTTNQRRLPFRDWAPILSNFLCRIYPDDENGDENSSVPARSAEANGQIDAFFGVFNAQLDKLEAIPRDFAGETTGAAAIRVLLKELAKTAIPPTPAANVVELQGWLDLPFDDAPNLILTGFNEGVVPTSKTSDLFLPNEARRELGLDDARRRFARDVYLTSALAASKRNFFVVFGRRSLQNDPLTPSRFAFATDPDRVPERICRFFANKGGGDLERLIERQEGRPFNAALAETAATETSTALAGPEIATFGLSPEPTPTFPLGFRPPILRLSGSAPTKMKATEFRDFLACPYRYFLKFALKLRAAAPETTAEMNAAAFGTLAHDALRDFGLDPQIRDSVDADEIAAWLSERLDAVSRRYFNELSSPFVRIQLEQIRWRLDAFARWQASWRRSGRRIEFVEASPESGAISFDVGGGRPVEIYGRVDRIDYDPKENRWFVFDYKTFDSAKEGRKAPVLDGDETALCDDVFDDETGATLFSTRIGNVVDEKHRRKAKPRKTIPQKTLEKYGLDEPDADAQDDETVSAFEWTDLQLPLYRRFFRQILFERYEGRRAWADVEAAKVSLGYVALTKSAKTQAFGAPWRERDLRAADATAARVVRTIRRLWRGPIDPDAFLDPRDPSRGTILASKAPAFSEELSPITLDFLKK